ncbi:MAG: type II toxin-antitoxin system mRNA interferase toxin, RelE/StbE family [Methylococcaceae bacterium]
MKILQSNLFIKTVKKLHKSEKELLDEVIKTLIAQPELGDLKTSDLNGVRVYKFKVNINQMLLAYRYQKETLVLMLLAYGTHENFYRDLKKSILNS